MKIQLGQQCMKSSIADTNSKFISTSRVMSKTFRKNKLIYIDLKDFNYPGKVTPTGVSDSWRFLYRDKESNFFSNDNVTFEFTVKNNILELEFFYS